MNRNFVQLARDDVEATMAEWQRLRELSPRLPALLDDPAVNTMIDRLVSGQIMLLRAVEEVEARPWWRRRRDNPYAR